MADVATMPLKMHPSIAVHPGRWLAAELVEPAGLSVTDLATRLGVSRQATSKLLDGVAGISAEMAIRFEKLFSISADTLMRMQANHDLAQARALAADIRVSPLGVRPDMSDEITPFDPAEHLGDADSIAELLERALATGDANVLANVMEIVDRACNLRGFSLKDLVEVSDNPEWSDAAIAAARPFAQVFPELAAKMRDQRERSKRS